MIVNFILLGAGHFCIPINFQFVLGCTYGIQNKFEGLSGGPVSKTLNSHCRGLRVDPQSES